MFPKKKRTPENINPETAEAKVLVHFVFILNHTRAYFVVFKYYNFNNFYLVFVGLFYIFFEGIDFSFKGECPIKNYYTPHIKTYKGLHIPKQNCSLYSDSYLQNKYCHQSKSD